MELKIGIVQRFGEEPTDHLKLQATPGDRLTLNFKQATLNADGSKTPSQRCQPGSCDATPTHTGSQGAGGSQYPPEL